MKSLWDVFGSELEIKTCDWCDGKPIIGDLYEFAGETVCRGCLESNEYEEPERGLTNEERNK